MNSPVLPGRLLAGRYLLHEALGGGDVAQTFRGQDETTQQEIIVKLMPLGHLASWKALELFEREVKVLSQIRHDRVPRVLDHFHDQASQALVLVTEYIPGESLQEKLEAGWRPDESMVRELLTQALEILSYLHARRPPLVHRDLKPSNMILDPDGQLYLIDFGSVQAALSADDTGPATVVGTFGYMAPEQYLGQAQPASDLYSLGVTAIEMLSSRELHGLVNPELKLDFRPYCTISRELADILEKLTAPGLTQRFMSCEEVLRALSGQQELQKVSVAPNASLVNIQRAPEHLILHSRPHARFRLVALPFLLVGLGLFHQLGVMLGPTLYQGGALGLAALSVWLPLVLLSFVCFGISLTLLGLQTELFIGPDNFRRVHTLLGLRFYRTGATQDLADCICPPGDEGRDRSNWLGRVWLLEGGRKRHDLGFGQRADDRDWICHEVRAFLLSRPTLARELTENEHQD